MEDYVRGYKYQIYPTKEQETKFNQMFGNARVVFNYAVISLSFISKKRDSKRSLLGNQ